MSLMNNKILDGGLPLKLQKLYIQRLKKMLRKYDDEQLPTCCPVGINLKSEWIKPFHSAEQNNYPCNFCTQNVGTEDCPCFCIDVTEARSRAENFIACFEAEYREV